MNWWTSIVFYLWRNSVRRWVEQPLGVLSKLAVAALIGGLGAAMMLGVSYIGKQISQQLASRDALMMSLFESIPQGRASAMMVDVSEDQAWGGLATEHLTLLQVAAAGFIEKEPRPIPIYAVINPESIGYPDASILITEALPAGSRKVVFVDGERLEAIVMPPRGRMIEDVVGHGSVLLGSTRRMSAMLQMGFSRRVMIEAKSVESIEHIEKIVKAMNVVEGRRIQMRSTLPLLLELKKIRSMQRNIAFAVTLGSALALGLICGALAWMEFREERYLLSLIRSFGVGRVMLFGHAMLENCMVAVSGMALGLGGLALAAGSLRSGPLNLVWMDTGELLSASVFGVLLLGALFGGVLACVPVAIGLRKPIGLVLK